MILCANPNLYEELGVILCTMVDYPRVAKKSTGPKMAKARKNVASINAKIHVPYLDILKFEEESIQSIIQEPVPKIPPAINHVYKSLPPLLTIENGITRNTVSRPDTSSLQPIVPEAKFKSIVVKGRNPPAAKGANTP